MMMSSDKLFCYFIIYKYTNNDAVFKCMEESKKKVKIKQITNIKKISTVNEKHKRKTSKALALSIVKEIKMLFFQGGY